LRGKGPNGKVIIRKDVELPNGDLCVEGKIDATVYEIKGAGGGGFVKTNASGIFLFDQAGGGGASALNDLTDVTLSGPTSGQHLEYNGTNWVNAAPAGGAHPNDVELDSIFDANTNEYFVFNSAASAVNHFEVSNAAAGGSPTFAAVGADTDISIQFLTQGAGFYNFEIGAGTPGAPFGFGGEVLINSGHLILGGLDTDPSSIRAAHVIQSAGSLLKLGYQQFEQAGAFTFAQTILELSSANPGAAEFDLNVNFFRMQNAEATVAPEMSALGADTDIDMLLSPKGLGQVVSSTGFETSSSDAYYLGAKDSDGSWRFVRNGTALEVERREVGVYVSKGSFTA